MFVRSVGAPVDEIRGKVEALGLGSVREIDPFEALVPGDGVELDPRVGGKWRIAMHGEQVFVQEGEYLEIEPNRKLVMTWRSEMLEPAETRVTVELKPHGRDETELTLVHEAFNNVESKDGYDGGWAAILEKLSQTLA